jgi:hypothetical protein
MAYGCLGIRVTLVMCLMLDIKLTLYQNFIYMVSYNRENSFQSYIIQHRLRSSILQPHPLPGPAPTQQIISFFTMLPNRGTKQQIDKDDCTSMWTQSSIPTSERPQRRSQTRPHTSSQYSRQMISSKPQRWILPSQQQHRTHSSSSSASSSIHTSILSFLHSASNAIGEMAPVNQDLLPLVP